MSEKGNALSRNPNVCASCSSLADGLAQLDSFNGDLTASGPTASPKHNEELRAEIEPDWTTAVPH
jgi:hypothetical protein